MKRLSLLCMMTSLILGADAQTAEPAGRTSSSAAAANKRLGRGINLGNALDAPREGAWGVYLKAEYFKAIKEAGFDSVRLPVKWSTHAQARAPYTLDPKFAARVDWAIDQALANGLNIIVNVHHYEGMDANPDQNLPRLVGLWEQIAARYKDRPAPLTPTPLPHPLGERGRGEGAVYFELLNEPHDKLTEAKWNAAIPRVLAAVRKTNPTRPVIVGPGQWNGIRALDKLQLPADDRNLIVTVHYYEPFHFTHQGASWVNGADKWKGRKWTGKPAEQAEIRQALDQVAAWGRAHDRPIFLGEFGAFEGADMESRARWTRFVVHEAQRRGFSWAYWEFCSGFGAYDPKTDQWRPALKAALVD